MALDLAPVSRASTTDFLYGASSLLLFGSALLIWLKNPRSRLHSHFALTALSLLLWLATLFLFDRTNDPSLALWLGRLNFAAMAPAVFFAYRFVQAVTGGGNQKGGNPFPAQQRGWEAAWVICLTAVTLLTPLVDRAEIVHGDAVLRHTTVYGPLFPLYLAHVVGFLVAAVLLAFRTRRESVPGPVRDQLLLIGIGTLATGLVSLVTNALLPYVFGDFRYTDVGPLSTLLFLLAVAYAVARHRLFDFRLFVRRTLVLGLLLSFALAAYSAFVLLATDRFTGEGSTTLTRFGVLVIAFSFDPLRRFLENRIDRLLFGRGSRRARKTQ
ncbi:MAG: histidine kinase N-terminal 7TM domain-containing protein [Armatimonadota bacterium]